MAAVKGLLRFLRSHPWWTGSVVGVLLVLGAWQVVEARARARLERSLRTWLAEHPATSAAWTPDRDGAGPVYLRALAALDPSMDGGDFLAMAQVNGTVPSEGREVLLKDAPALSLIEEAIALPYLGAPAGARTTRAELIDLARLLLLRARVEEEDGRRADAVRTLLLVHRMVRQVGAAGSEPLVIDASYAMRTLEGLLRAVEEPGMDEGVVREILRDALTPEEVGSTFARGYARFGMRALAEEFLTLLGPESAGHATRVGRKSPTLHQRLSRVLGRPYPGNVWDIPSAREMEEIWEEERKALDAMGRLAAIDFPFMATKPSEYGSLGDRWADQPRRAEGAVRYVYCMASWLSVLHAAAGARLHQLRTGALPRTLDEIVPGTVPSLPPDPFTGRPPAWTLSGGEGLVESAGPPPGDGRMNYTWPRGREPKTRARLR